MICELHGCPGDRISVKLHCYNCHSEWIEEFEIPFPDFDSDKDTHAATSYCEYETICCPSCESHLNVTLESSCCGSWLSIDELEDDDCVTISIETRKHPCSSAAYPSSLEAEMEILSICF